MADSVVLLCRSEALAQSLLPRQLQLTCYYNPNTCSELRSHGRHGRPTLSNEADRPVYRLAYVSSTFQRNLVSTYRIAQIITWIIHWSFIACRLGRITHFNVWNSISHSLWFLNEQRLLNTKSLSICFVCAAETERASCGREISVLRMVQMNIAIERIN